MSLEVFEKKTDLSRKRTDFDREKYVCQRIFCLKMPFLFRL